MEIVGWEEERIRGGLDRKVYSVGDVAFAIFVGFADVDEHFGGAGRGGKSLGGGEVVDCAGFCGGGKVSAVGLLELRWLPEYAGGDVPG